MHRTTIVKIIILSSIIIAVIIGSVFMISKASKNFKEARDNLLAQNLTDEGLDAINITLDSNLIRYKDAKCWNFDLYNRTLPCDNNKRLEGKYKLEPDLMPGMFGIKLINTNGNLINESGADRLLNNEYLLSEEAYRGQQTNGTNFYRMIEIGYNKIAGKDDKLTAVSTIGWDEGGGC